MTEFLKELETWGPGAIDSWSVTLEEARAYCQRLATSHYENFTVVSWLLPKELHQHFHHVYAYCRWSDDLGDEVGDPKRSLELLDWWKGELDRCYAGDTSHPVFVALAETIAEFEIPAQPFRDLISAFRQDQTVTEYETRSQLFDYCTRSANPVGRLVLYLCRSHTEQNVAWSDAICTGLQLANFWQDVARDFEIGRIYLPKEDRKQFGYSDTDFQNRVTNDAFLNLMQFEVEETKTLLESGSQLIQEMPGRLQIDIDLFLRGGLKILERVERIGYRVWEQRPVVTKRDAVKLFGRSLGSYLLRKCGWKRNMPPARTVPVPSQPATPP